jgi:isopenicillin N synthase-like dioxygenase
MPDIPVIDISSLHAPDTLATLDLACRDWGFFQIVNHGLDPAIFDGVLSQAHAFFALPGETKRRVERTEANPWGFYDRELTKNALDWKEIFDYGPANGTDIRPRWPQRPSGLRTSVVAYYEACEVLAFKLLGAISANLGVPRDFLYHAFEPAHSSFVRINYYPVCTGSGADKPLGIHHHTDAGALTILLQDDQPGLEVFRAGTWSLVPVIADAPVVNIGDVVQVWSNDRYQAALHRVRSNGQVARYSAPFFFNPSYAADYAPLTSTLDGAHARYRAINWGEFRGLRAAGDYRDLGEEVQITQYRTRSS